MFSSASKRKIGLVFPERTLGSAQHRQLEPSTSNLMNVGGGIDCFCKMASSVVIGRVTGSPSRTRGLIDA